MLKKKVLFVAFLLVLFMFSYVPVSQARSLDHTSTNAVYGPRSSYQYWQGTTDGVSVNIVASNPAIATDNTGYHWWRNVVLKHNTSSDQTNSLIVGIGKSNTPGGNFCQSSKTYLLLYVEGYSSNSDHMMNYCYNTGLPSSVINGGLWIDVHPYVSGGGGLLIQVYQSSANGFTMPPQYWSYADGAPVNFSRIQYEEEIFNNFTNHNVWGSDWLNSAYHDNGYFTFQNRGPDFLTSGNPPQMFWNAEPGGNSGGDMLTCVYPSGSYNCVSGQ